ncbi:hypothetical protein KP79_PYT22945 [Mizuhopecten yessoensis]|uniref:Uncharacterized protein n=1 Tax=Mizuhopecten yessoensis TaxID=6573 RepID=A0A210QXM1_MIZYE|nr:hypothetical protein KP79_PYT22945 [Mizuhopecten yessoensis]
MQRQANLVSEEIKALNKKDMAEKTGQVVDGDADPSTIGIALDGRTSCAGQMLGGKCYYVNCSGGHSDSTANTDRYDGL